MPVSKALRRLLHVRNSEEEQHRLALESGLSDLRALQNAYKSARARERAGRVLFSEAICSGEIADRSAALLESHVAIRCAAALALRVSAAEAEVLRLRQAYLVKRLERRQAQTIVQEAEAQAASESGRRGQQALDEAHGTRRYREERGAGKRRP